MSTNYQELRFRSKALGDAILPREMAKFYGTEVPLEIGETIDAAGVLQTSSAWARANLETPLSPYDLRKIPEDPTQEMKFILEVLTQNAFVANLRSSVYNLKSKIAR